MENGTAVRLLERDIGRTARDAGSSTSPELRDFGNQLGSALSELVELAEAFRMDESVDGRQK
jgi:hypothetical protein